LAYLTDRSLAYLAYLDPEDSDDRSLPYLTLIYASSYNLIMGAYVTAEVTLL
jgi:hypothetical protein